MDWKTTAQTLGIVAAPLVVVGAAVAVAHAGGVRANPRKGSGLRSYNDYWLKVIGDVDADTAVSKYDLVPDTLRGFDEWLDEAESIAHVDASTKKVGKYHDRADRELHAAANRTKG